MEPVTNYLFTLVLHLTWQVTQYGRAWKYHPVDVTSKPTLFKQNFYEYLI